MKFFIIILICTFLYSCWHFDRVEKNSMLAYGEACTEGRRLNLGEPVHTHGYLRHIKAKRGIGNETLTVEPSSYDYFAVAQDLVLREFKFVEVLQDNDLVGSQGSQATSFFKNGDKYDYYLSQDKDKKYFKYFLSETGDARCGLYNKWVSDAAFHMEQIRETGLPEGLCIATEKKAKSEAEYELVFDLKTPPDLERYKYRFKWRQYLVRNVNTGETIAELKDFEAGTSGRSYMRIFSCLHPETAVEKIEHEVIKSSPVEFDHFDSDVVRAFYKKGNHGYFEKIDASQVPPSIVIHPDIEEVDFTPYIIDRNKLPHNSENANGNLYLMREDNGRQLVLVNRLNEVAKKVYLPRRPDYPIYEEIRAILFSGDFAVIVTPFDAESSKIIIFDKKGGGVARSYNLVFPMERDKNGLMNYFLIIDEVEIDGGVIDMRVNRMVSQKNGDYQVTKKYHVAFAIDSK